MTPTISATPVLSWPGEQLQEVRVACTLRAGLTTADYTDLTLTIWEDPEYPRAAEKKSLADRADPDQDWGAPVVTAAGEWDGTTAVFAVEVPPGAGYRRYALKVTATRAGGLVVLVKTCWLSVTA